jgi:signal transduction histidine kinase
MKLGRRFRNLPLFWKLLLPFLALMIVVGAFGVFVIARDLGSRAQTGLEQDVARRSLDAHSLLRDRELFLLESTNLAANLEGMAAAIGSRNDAKAGRLLQSVIALKTELDIAAVGDGSGIGLVEFRRGSEATPTVSAQTNWAANEFVSDALSDASGGKHAGFLTLGDRSALAIAAPVCVGQGECRPVGVAITGIAVDKLVEVAAGKQTDDNGAVPGGSTSVAIIDPSGNILASKGTVPRKAATDRLGISRQTGEGGSGELITLSSAYEVQGRRVGTLAVSISTTKALASVRGAAFRLSIIVLLAMVGVVIVGAALSRAILRQVSALLEANRAIGRGDLTARVPVESGDELGEFARGVNQMAEQLQGSYETLEIRVAQRTEEVQRLLRERTEFFASLSHELRTPLAVILGEVKLMHDDGDAMPNWVREAAERLGQSAEQLLSLVNEVLELARGETGRLEIRTSEVDVPQVVDEMRSTIKGLARTGDVDVNVKLPPGLPKVRADRVRLREVLVNLVDNAVKYTPQGGRVELSAAAHNGSVEISVADNGVGIPRESIPLLFEPFYRVPGVTTQRGQAASGLGLALAKRLVEAQGGIIRVKSKPGTGSEFSFTVPLYTKKVPAK